MVADVISAGSVTVCELSLEQTNNADAEEKSADHCHSVNSYL